MIFRAAPQLSLFFYGCGSSTHEACKKKQLDSLETAIFAIHYNITYSTAR